MFFTELGLVSLVFLIGGIGAYFLRVELARPHTKDLYARVKVRVATPERYGPRLSRRE